MSITVVIPVKNDATRLRACLSSISGALAPGSAAPEIVVADNGSTDDSPTVAAAAGARVMRVPDVAVGELRNTAAASASGSLLAFIDADHELGTGWFDAAAESFLDENVAAAGALYLPPPQGTWVQRMYGALRGQTVGTGETGWLGSGNMLVRRDVFERLGGFDTSLEACEDVDLCRRIRACGMKVIADERFRSIHHGDPPTLAALFRAERWRGRDNLRVSLRGPFDLRDLPSIVTPVLTLTGLAAAIPGLLGYRPAQVVAGISAAVLLALISIRSARMVARLNDGSIGTLLRAFAVGVTYEAARAVALVTRAPHHRR